MVAVVATLALVGGTVAATSPAEAANGAMIVPATGRITGTVGSHCGANDTHSGTDIARLSGGQVVAAAAGTVVSVTQSTATTGYGTQVVLQHAAGYTTRYAHLVVNSTTVTPGQSVRQGQALGSMGSTGASSGVHLHFEVRVGGAVQDGLNSYFTCGRNVTLGTPVGWSFPGLGDGLADRDGDKIPNAADSCPDTAGFGLYAGCGLPRTANSTDFDGNGRADVFYGNPNGQWWASDGGTSNWRTLASGNVETSLFQFADFDGDRRSDVFWPSADGSWRISSGGVSSWVRINGAREAPGHELQLGDFDGDGRADVFWANSAKQTWQVSYGGTSAWVTTASDVPNTDIRIADLDGDGRDDVFWAHPTGAWWAASSAKTPWRTMASAGVPMAEMDLADLDGDRRADVFWANRADGRWYVSSGGVASWLSRVFAGDPPERLQLGDLDGDGRADVHYADLKAGVWLSSSGAVSSWQRLAFAGVDPRLLVVR
ncbi:VCBS repeat protein [Frigoribacterium sp. PhB24]|nr:VCBS repeat protein [Frigoribacterium sp. PhB24]